MKVLSGEGHGCRRNSTSVHASLFGAWDWSLRTLRHCGSPGHAEKKHHPVDGQAMIKQGIPMHTLQPPTQSNGGNLRPRVPRNRTSYADRCKAVPLVRRPTAQRQTPLRRLQAGKKTRNQTHVHEELHAKEASGMIRRPTQPWMSYRMPVRGSTQRHNR